MLELLHKCLVPSDAPNEEEFKNKFQLLNDLFSKYKDFRETKKKQHNEDGIVVSEEEFTDNDVFDQQYVDAVRQLRIDLLGS